ncbi:MAG: hypothetical protein WD602_09185 [Actinomycetota bacterium]
MLKNDANRRLNMKVRPSSLTTVISVVAMVSLAGAVAWGQLPSFDGGMNLQVAKSLADSGLYGRSYDGLELFPSGVQTNGIPLLVGALSIKVAGLNEFSLQVPNLIFLAALAILFVLLARPLPWLGALAPLVLLGVPVLLLFGLGGYGEVPTFTFQLAAFLLLAHGLSAQNRSVRRRYQLGAFSLAGVAIVTKTVGVAVLPALVLMVGLQRVADRKSDWRLDLASIAALLAPIAAFEAFRLVHFGNVDEYLAYWSYSVDRIGYHSGLSGGAAEGGYKYRAEIPFTTEGLSAPEFRMQRFGETFAWGRGFALMFVGTPLLFAVTLWVRTLRRMWREPRPLGSLKLLILGLSAFIAIYFAWWLFITPLERLWPRRIMIGTLALYALYLLLLRLVRGERGYAGRGLAAAVLLSVLLVAAAAPWIPPAVAVSPYRSANLADFKAAVDFVDSLPAEARVYGYGWWSAPQLGLYVGRTVRDLSVVPVCEVAGLEAYLIWEDGASRLSSPEPPTRGSRLDYDLVAEFEDTADIYRVRPAEGLCDDRAG